MNDSALSVELEVALLRELRARYDLENNERFAASLVAPVFVLSDSAARLGQWVSKTRTLEISRTMVLTKPWPDVVSVLEHEMAHQFVDEVLRAHSETPHGETFQRVCAERGIDARAAGAPNAATSDSVTSPVIDRTLERIRKLLALAGSANEHEAEVAMRKAHELMLHHNIDDARARTEHAYQVRHVGDASKRTNRVEVDIVGLLSEFFFVKVIRVPVYLPLVGKRGSVYEIIGTQSNVEMASHVYSFLLATADQLWRVNKNDSRVRSGRDRLSYQSGVVRGFREKLSAERAELRGTGLVWRGDAKLDGFTQARHPRVTMRRRRIRIDGAHAAGREAGRTVVLNRPNDRGSSGGIRLLRS